MRSLALLLFGLAVGITITFISPYNALDWQWWVAVLVIGIFGIIYANVEDKRR